MSVTGSFATSRIFLTGASGMVGRNVIELARLAGIEVLAPGRVELDLRDQRALTEYLRQHRPDIVVHAAGTVGGIQANIREPVRFMLDNLDVGRNVVCAAREAGVTRLLNLGSSCMYPRNAQNPLREEQVLTGELEPTNEGYALAKISILRLCEYVSREQPVLRYKTLIPCNIYGRYDKFDPAASHMVPAILHKLHSAKTAGSDTVEIWGDGTARREFMYAGDLAHCILRAVDYFQSLPALMNAGIGRDYSVNEYYEVGAKVVGWRGRFVHDTSRPVGMRQKLVDSSRARTWGWTAETSLEEGMKLTYEHYLEKFHGHA